MVKIRIAYVKQLGNKELKQAKKIFAQKEPTCLIELIGTGYKRAFTLLQNRQADLVIADARRQGNSLQKELLASPGLVAVLQKGTYPAGMQMIDKDELRDLTCFLICDPGQEKEELELQQKIWQLKSPFMAVNDFDEASVLIAGGSGFFVMNELTARLISNDTLQKLFLLAHGQQMKQRYYAFWRRNQKFLRYFIDILKNEYQSLE